jgi:3-hydroxyisobutyrate dehydrogenase
MQLGYVGLGNMGAALARRLLRKDKMRVYDLRPEAMVKLAGLGGVSSQSPEALASESDLVMTCLPTSKEVREVIFGSDGLASGLKKGAIIADMTTGDPSATREMAKDLAASGITLIDAPVSGGPQAPMPAPSPSWSVHPLKHTRASSPSSRPSARMSSIAATSAPAMP